MESNVNYSIVGAFVVIFTTALILIIFWLSVGLTSKDYNYYLVYMNESVAGLTPDSSVKYNGVDIGSVKKISVNTRNMKQVRILLAIDEQIPIKTDTIATLISQGLTGISYINLSGGSPKAPLLKPRPNKKYPVITTEPSLFFRLDSMIRELGESLTKTSNDLQNVLNAENQLAIKNSLAHLDKITGTIAANSEELNASMRSASHALRAFSSETLPETAITLRDIQKLANNLNAFTTNLEQNPSILIRGRAPAPPGPGE